MGIRLRNGIHFLQHSVQFPETLSEVWDEEKLDCDIPVLAEQRCVSLLKSKSGFLIRKRIFRFFTKIQKRIIDPNDPQRRWILWIISRTGYFGYTIRSVSLLRIRKERIQPAGGNSKQFNTYSSCLTTLLIFTAVSELEAWIKRSILSILSE